MNEIVLRYVGEGTYIEGVPACDLTQQMIDECGVPVVILLAYRNGDKPLYEVD